MDTFVSVFDQNGKAMFRPASPNPRHAEALMLEHFSFIDPIYWGGRQKYLVPFGFSFPVELHFPNKLDANIDNVFTRGMQSQDLTAPAANSSNYNRIFKGKPPFSKVVIDELDGGRWIAQHVLSDALVWRIRSRAIHSSVEIRLVARSLAQTYWDPKSNQSKTSVKFVSVTDVWNLMDEGKPNIYWGERKEDRRD